MYHAYQSQNGRAELSEATIEEVHVNEFGQVLIDVIDDSGDFFNNVKICGVGGNTIVWSNFPIRKKQRVKLLKCGDYSHPICLGATEKIINEEDLSNLKPLIVSSSTVVGNDEDVVSNYTTDWAVVNNGNQLKITENNGVVANSSQMLRLQLFENALLRISKDGSTIDNPLNGQQFIDTLFAYLDALETKVNANSAAIGAQAPYSSAAATAAGAVHTTAAATATGQGNAVLAASETAAAVVDNTAASNITSTAATAATALTTTSATTKTSAEGNINQNIRIP